MNIDGGCHCGHITYEAEIDAETAMICHCTDCQALSGSAFRVVVMTREGTFKLRSGDIRVYVKTGESGTQRAQAFCPHCGTPIYSSALGDTAKVHSIRVGTIRQRNQLVPKMQLWGRSAQSWLGQLGSMPRLEKQPMFDPKGGVTLPAPARDNQ
jgi:hypothetical protein